MKGLPAALTPLSGSETTLVLQSGTAKQIPVISIPATALNLTQTLSGSATLYNWNTLTTTSDTQGCDFCTDFNVTHTFGGATHRGAHEGIFSFTIQNAPNSGSGTTVNIPLTAVGQNNTGDGGTGLGFGQTQGSVFGGNMVMRNGGTNMSFVNGMEVDNMSTSGSSARISFGVSSANFESVQGSSEDAAFVAYSGPLQPANSGGGPWGPGVGWHTGILFSDIDSSLPPLDSGATVLGTYLGVLSNIPVAWGIDLRGFSVANCTFASTKFCVDGSGRVQVDGATARSNAMDIGPDSGINVVQINGGNSTGTGALLDFCAVGTCLGSIGFPSAVLGGTFVQNLGIFGFTGLNFYTNNVLNWTMNTSGNFVGAGTVSAGSYSVNGVQGVSCSAGTVSTATLTIVSGIVTHC